MKRKNISPSKFLEDFSNQKRTPKSAQNVEMEERKPAYTYYVTGIKRGFISQKDLSEIVHLKEVANSIAKRNNAR